MLAPGDFDKATSMTRSRLLLYVLILSISLNLGVLAGVGYRALESARAPDSDEAFAGLVSHLGLREEQQRHWREAETAFLAQFGPRAAEIRERRDRLIRAIFADDPDPAAIESERARISALQNAQQRAVVEQLLRERELLDAEQRERLVKLLLEQPPGAVGFEQLHRD